MSTYVWTHAPEELLPKSWGQYDELSQFGSWQVLGTRRLEPDLGEAIFRFNWGVKKLRQWACPPVIGQTIVHKDMIDVIRRFADDEEVTFYPVTCICRDGTSHDYVFVAPRFKIKCINFDRSILTPDPLDSGVMKVTRWELLNFHYGCLGSHPIAWEDHLPACMVVSEALKDALLATGGQGLHFVRPRDYVKY
jgi:hypothetical protein